MIPGPNCQRCHKPTGTTTGSYFNEQMICLECEAKEKAHPQYEAARAAELQAVKGGNYNFPGIGLPPDLR